MTFYSTRRPRSMKQYIRPEVLVSYTIEELAEEAAVCVAYGPIDVPPPSDDIIPT
jgi:hypothetical protein